MAVGAFGIGTTEFAPMGLLRVIAGGLDVSIPKAGLLVPGYALDVMFGAPLLTLPTGRIDRKLLLVGLMALFTAGNVMAALAPDYGWLMAARLVTSLCHGSFFGVGSVVAANLIAPERRARAVAAMFSGLTFANVGGVPRGVDRATCRLARGVRGDRWARRDRDERAAVCAAADRRQCRDPTFVQN